MSSRSASATPWTPNQYPPARRSDHVDVYKSEKHGEVRVSDPYQWLEEHSEETDKWTTAQDAFTRSYLDKNADRAKLESAIRANTDYAKFSAPALKHDGRWYWYYNSGLQAQSVIYRSKDDTLPNLANVDGPGGEVFFDPNMLSTDGTAALAATAFSRSGKYFAYGISLSGSDFFTVYVRSTEKPLAQLGEERADHNTDRLEEEVRFVKFSGISWDHGSNGFFYQRYPGRVSHGLASEDKAGTETTDDKDAMLYYHKIGTPQSEDILVVKDAEHPEWMWGASVSEVDGKYLYLDVSRDTAPKNLLWVADLENDQIGQNMKWDKVIDEFDAQYGVIANDGSVLYLRTNKNAPQYKVITIDLADPTRTHKDLIPEQKDAFLDSVLAVGGDKLAVVYKRNVKDEIYLYSLSGTRLTRLASDFVGAADVTGRRTQPNVFITLTGFTNPGIVARYDLHGQTKFDDGEVKERWSVWRETQLKGLKADEFVAEQVWYESKDGTKVPMFIVRHTSTKLDGTAPAIQYGYGGFSIAINPSFSPAILTFVKMYSGLYALPNIRGGGEFGEDWHEAGIREKKINVFDDFIAATKYLITHKYAAPGKVAINGGSNGGLLVGACVNLAPAGAFGAAVAEVGVLDLLKVRGFVEGVEWTKIQDAADKWGFVAQSLGLQIQNE
ncbi:prolyl oligopeptidase [Hygrophoropsis aurantiaca]|uniref:Prolyl oligopeptidase n=1 Tax=Hygrophoropsis aurantiaca TaxID=72124 RepID=A0ACB8A3H0_9AGAM|nr:prolyl oligopeptidase [Hygrophoropsis aurantiaca]